MHHPTTKRIGIQTLNVWFYPITALDFRYHAHITRFNWHLSAKSLVLTPIGVQTLLTMKLSYGQLCCGILKRPSNEVNVSKKQYGVRTRPKLPAFESQFTLVNGIEHLKHNAVI